MAYELFVDSFDTETFSHAGTTPLATGRWSIQAEATGSGSIATSPGNGRRSTSSMRLTAPGSVFGVHITSKVFSPSAYVVAGFWLKRTAGSNTITFSFRSNTTTLVNLVINSLGTVSVTLGGSTYTSTRAIPTTECYVEIGVVIGGSGSLQVRINGEATGWLDLSGVNTQPGSNTTLNNARLTMNSGVATIDIDDLYIAYGNELKWLGDIRVDALALTADATPQDWTPDTGNAWERINATAGYITGTTLGNESLFELADYSVATTAIHGLVVNASARKTDAGSRSFAIEVKSDATTDVGGTVALGDTATEYRQVWLTDPDTATAWTDGGIDALQVGVVVTD